jgi:hypothetical protein
VISQAGRRRDQGFFSSTFLNDNDKRRIVMIRRTLLGLFVCLCASAVFAQEFSGIQIHGFVTQGVLYSTNNNLFTMPTSNGSAQWTDGAISISDSVSDKLRVGIQLHAYQFGEFGGPSLQIDWASADYRASDKARFSVGKVKTVYGLFNDTQDVDTAHLWSLLPEGFYPTDNKSFELAHYGADFYGAMPLGKKGGTISYRAYAGYRPLDLNGGYAKQIGEIVGSTFASGGSNVLGGDLRWDTPLKGLQIGMSALTTGLSGMSPGGSFHLPYFTAPVPYAKFERGKFMAAGEYKRLASQFNLTLNTPGGAVFVPGNYDARSWYVMSSYQVLRQLRIGGYYSHYISGGTDQSQPQNYSKEWVVSGRYDFNPHFYAKLEEHFINGTALGYYGSTNPNGLKPKTDALAARIGFTF